MSVTTCDYYDNGVCRSCGLLKLPYPKQLEQKRQVLASSFAQFLAFDSGFEIVPSDSVFESRNKAKMAVGGKRGAPIFGVVAENYEVKDLSSCPLHIPALREVLQNLAPIVSKFSLTPYNISKRVGEFKYMILRASESNAEMLLRFVLRSKDELSLASGCMEALQKIFPQIVVTSVNLQPVPQAILEGEEEILISKRDYILEKLGDVTLSFSPQSFSQVTSNVARKLYSFVAQEVKAAGIQSLLDLYCGVGAFSLFCAKTVKSGIGVELSAQDIENAKRGCGLNAVSGFEFIAMDVAAFMSSFNTSVDGVIVNPPRRGLSADCVKHLKRIKPRFLAYSSCNPETLLRDLEDLADSFTVRTLRAFDMFPMTEHVETVAILEAK